MKTKSKESGFIKAIKWGLPLVILGFYFGANLLEKNYQENRLSGWTNIAGYELNNPVSEIAVDEQGRVWVGNFENQLTVYDGGEKSSFTPGSIWAVSHIVFDSGNRAWIGVDPQSSEQRGWLSVRDGNKWVKYSTSIEALSDNTGITALAVDQRDHIWLSTGQDLIMFDGISWIVYNSQKSDLPAEDIYSIAADNQNKIWVASWGPVLSVYDGKTWISYQDEMKLSTTVIETVKIDNSGNIWVGTQNEISRFDGTQWTKFPRIGAVDIAFTDDDHVWAASWNGLHVFNDGEWVLLSRQNSGLPSNWIENVEADRDGNIWIGSMYYGAGLSVASAAYEPVRDQEIQIRNFLYSPSASLFISVLLAALWLAVLIDAVPTVSLATLIGLISLLPGLNDIDEPFRGFTNRNDLATNPGVYAIVAAVAAALLFSYLRTRGSKSRWPLILAVVAAAIGYAVGLVAFALATFHLY